MSGPPFMQMYWSDYFGDTRHLSCEQHGAYLQLLGSMWLANGRLPNDPRKLAKITGCTASRWAKIAADVLAFFDVDGAEITHGRIGLELEKAHEKSIKRADAGSRGGRAKSLKTRKPSVANATDLPQHSPEPEPDSISEPKGSSPRFDAKVGDFTAFWQVYPEKVGKAAARKAYAKAIRTIPGPDPPGVILAGVERAKASRAWVGGYIPHPATWLNRGSWEDEPAEIIPINGPRNERPHPDQRATAFRERLGDIGAAMALAVEQGRGSG